jgi:hypothetical protein
VRNIAGVRSRFAFDRFVRDEVLRGNDIASARAAGRQLLRDLRRAGVDFVTTDDIRHWLFERDPLVFTHRRAVRARAADGTWRFIDPALGRIAALAETFLPLDAPLVTELFLDHFRPGASEVRLRVPDDEEAEKEKVPPVADVELRWSDIADGLMPRDADYTGFGSAGKPALPLDPAETRQAFFFFIGADDTVSTLTSPKVPAPIRCDTAFLVLQRYYRSAPGCTGVDYRSLVRAALLYAIEEAFRLCRTSPCTRAVPRLISASWGCGLNHAVASVDLEIVCVAI